MTMRNAPATIGYVRRVAFIAGCVAIVIALAIRLQGEVAGVENLRERCTAGNTSRQLQRDTNEDLRRFAQSAVIRVSTASDAADPANVEAVREYQKIVNNTAARIVDLIAANAAVAVKPGSVQIDCEVAYPYPAPASWFD